MSWLWLNMAFCYCCCYLSYFFRISLTKATLNIFWICSKRVFPFFFFFKFNLLNLSSLWRSSIALNRNAHTHTHRRRHNMGNTLATHLHAASRTTLLQFVIIDSRSAFGTLHASSLLNIIIWLLSRDKMM